MKAEAKTVEVMEIDEPVDEAAERGDRSAFYNGIDPRRWRQAGEFLNGIIGPDTWVASRWARAHSKEISQSTLTAILRGSYNMPGGPTLDKLWGLCRELADHDERAARRICYTYLATLGIVPKIEHMALAAELSACEAALQKISDKIR